MTKLNVSDTRSVGKEGGKILSNMIAQNSVLTELNVSSNCKYSSDDGSGFAKELAIGISDNGALHCVDGTLYQSETSSMMSMMSTHACCHCGQHKTQHTSR
jgi:hypothetical protein